jgi:FkbM family methyltransferase
MDLAALRRLGRPLKRSLDRLSRKKRFHSSKSPVWYRMKDGFWMKLDPTQSVDREMVTRGGVWEPALRELIRNCVRPGDMFIDIGAHKGWATCVAAQQVGQSGRVLSIDPDPRAFAVLSENIQRNGFSQVSARQVAIGQSDGFIKLALTRTLGNSSTFPNYIAECEVVQEIRVPCVTLDSLLSTFDMGSRDLRLIKIDAEGAEPLIWQGMQTTLARCKPMIAMEVNYASLEAAGFAVAEFKRALEDAGYTACFQTFYGAKRRGRGRLRLQPTDIVRREGELLIDVLAVPDLSDRMKVVEPFIEP